MVILNFAGIILMILGMVTGIALYVNSINDKIKHITSLISLFCCSLIGGPFLCKMATSTSNGFLWVSYYLFSLGVASAVTLFLTEIGFMNVKSKTTLWVFFIFGILLGAKGIYSL